MHETPRTYNFLRTGAALFLALGSTAVTVDVLIDRSLPKQDRVSLNLSFMMPKLQHGLEKVAATTTTTSIPTTTTTAAPATTTTVAPAETIQPSPSAVSPEVVSGLDATDAFTPDWWHCVITPESGGDFSDTSGGYGILISTWQSYGMTGVPGDYPPGVQAAVALKIYAANGGFGPSAWNNSANCGKDG